MSAIINNDRAGYSEDLSEVVLVDKDTSLPNRIVIGSIATYRGDKATIMI